jgi:hypothetical protein
MEASRAGSERSAPCMGWSPLVLQSDEACKQDTLLSRMQHGTVSFYPIGHLVPYIFTSDGGLTQITTQCLDSMSSLHIHSAT